MENSASKLHGYQTITPAYGRDYKNKAEAEKDFRDGKDFFLQSYNAEGYCSIRDFAPGSVANIRYAKGSKVHPVKV